MKKIFVTLLLSCPFITAFAQQKTIDSLKTLLSLTKFDSVKVDVLLALNREYLADNPAEAIRYATEARTLAEKNNYLKGLAYAYKGLGMVYNIQGKATESIENYDHSLAIFDSLGDKRGQANILNNEGAVYFSQANTEKALELYLKGLQIAEQTTDSLRIATILVNIGGVYSNDSSTYDKALDYYFKALPIARSLDDKALLGTLNVNIGEIYFFRNDLEKALKYFQESRVDYEGTENYPYAVNYIGKVYQGRKEYETAIRYHNQALEYAKKLDASLDIAQSFLGLGDTYRSKGNFVEAINSYDKAETIALSIKDDDDLKNIYSGLSDAYASRGDFNNAYKYQSKLTAINNTLYSSAKDKKLLRMEFNFNMQKKEAQVDLLTKDKALQDVNLKRQRLTRNALIGGLALVFIITVIIYRNYRNKIKTNEILDSQKTEIENLLLNILPADVAQELQKHGVATARYYEKASVLFTDIKSFSKLADELSPQEVVTELNECFVAFDDIIGKYNLEKIKTIGDSYMCAGGIPRQDDSHIINIIKASLEIQEFIKERNTRRVEQNLPPWDIRIGINTGPLVAGVVGKKKYAYDIWGGTVNVASRMESNGEPGRVNISEATYELIKHKYACTHRGKIFAKNIGDIDMYFVDGELN